MLKDQTLENETGFDTSIQIGGINKKCRGGQYSPTVKLYMNDETFISGGITNASPFLLFSKIKMESTPLVV
jgi:hypothetical protein